MLAGFELCFLLKRCCPPPALLFSIVKIMLLLRNLFILIHSFLFFQRSWWHPTLVLLPRKSHGRRSLVGCSPWGRNESDTTERLHFHFSLSRIGEGNDNPLQCSCLENPRDGGAWWAAVYGVAQSQKRLKQLSSSLFFLSEKFKALSTFSENKKSFPPWGFLIDLLSAENCPWFYIFPLAIEGNLSWQYHTPGGNPLNQHRAQPSSASWYVSSDFEEEGETSFKTMCFFMFLMILK